MFVCLCEFICTIRGAGAHGDQSVESFQVGVASVRELCHVGAEDQAQALLQTSKYSERLTHLFHSNREVSLNGLEIALDSIHPFVSSRLASRATTSE